MANNTSTTVTITHSITIAPTTNSSTSPSESGNFSTTPLSFTTTDYDNSTSTNSTVDVVTVSQAESGIEPYVIAVPIVCGILVVTVIISIVIFLRRRGKRKGEKTLAVMPPSKEELGKREFEREVSVTPSYIEFVGEGNDVSAEQTQDVLAQEPYVNVSVKNGIPANKEVYVNSLDVSAPEYENLTPKSKQRAKVAMLPNKSAKPLKIKLPPRHTPKPESSPEQVISPCVYIDMKHDTAAKNKIAPTVPTKDTYTYTHFSGQSDKKEVPIDSLSQVPKVGRRVDPAPCPPRKKGVPIDILSQVPKVDSSVEPASCPARVGYINITRDCDAETAIEYETDIPTPSQIYENTLV